MKKTFTYNKHPELGKGIYTARDAATILQIPYAKTKHWFKYYAKNKLSGTLGHQYFFEVKNVTAIDFFTLIEMYVFFSLKENGFTTADILKQHRNMGKLLKTPYPFASEQMYIDNFRLLFGDDSLLVDAGNSQTVISNFLLPLCKKIKYTNQTLAHKYYPLGQEKSVVINPEHQFGTPIVDGTNIMTAILYNFHLGGESVNSISRLYNLSEQNVIHAIEFHKAAA